ncbi:MAG: hypothetical protein KDD60_04630 [Bdellovibrionales bacterium]|nr:hypothetical protein [Bdellovibrionales bacterium]
MLIARAICLRELRILWRTPLPYLAFLVLLLTGVYFLAGYIKTYEELVGQFQAGFIASENAPNFVRWVILPYFETLGFFFVFIVPVLFGRLSSDDSETGASAMIVSTGVAALPVILGRFLALALSAFAIILAASLPMYFLVWQLEISFLFAHFGVFALSMLVWMYVALGVAVGQSLRHPIAASLLHFVLLLALYFAHSMTGAIGNSIVVNLGLPFADVASAVAPVLKFRHLLEGFVRVSDVGYFMAIIVSCLLYSWVHLSQESHP